MRLADGDAAGAEVSLAEAVRLWNEVGAPYEAAVARTALADAHAAGGGAHRAALEREAAREVFATIAACPSPAPPTTERPHAAGGMQPDSANAFRHDGDYWTVVFEGDTVHVRDLKGLRYLARLLANPGREYHVLDLVAAERGDALRPVRGQAQEVPGSGLGDVGEMLDARAKNAYRRRLTEIDEDIEQARADGDLHRAAQADTERDFLVRELAHAFGLSGRGRPTGSASERARAAVTRAVRQSMARLGKHHPRLGEHLTRTVRTGTYCGYFPDPRLPADWTF